MPRMTQARTHANEVGSPSLSQLSLAELLRAFVALVLNVVLTVHMKRNRQPHDWHTGPADASLPRTKSDTQQQEPNPVAASDSAQSALMVSRPLRGRPSNHEGVLTHIAL